MFNYHLANKRAMYMRDCRFKVFVLNIISADGLTVFSKVVCVIFDLSSSQCCLLLSVELYCNWECCQQCSTAMLLMTQDCIPLHTNT